ncbi:MAG: DUF2794 domain-containing protein [Pseudomonadota bacterium]
MASGPRSLKRLGNDSGHSRNESSAKDGRSADGQRRPPLQIFFTRDELSVILNIYGRMVAAGEWRDYAMEATRTEAVFAVFKRSSEMPVYRVIKRPALAQKQGAFLVLSASGQTLKRGRDLAQVLKVLQPLLMRVVD